MPRRLAILGLRLGKVCLGVGVVGVCCKPKGMRGVVAILDVSCQLNTMTRTLLRVLKKVITSSTYTPTNKTAY
jgi:hypothetical protein